MFRRRSLTLCAVICALVAIIGAGFSAWALSAERSGDVNLGVNISGATAFGEMTFPSQVFRIQLDQGGSSDAADVSKGITLEQSADGSGSWSKATLLSATWRVSKQSYDSASANPSKPIGYSINIYIKADTLGEYVELPAASGFAVDSALATSRSGYNAYTKALGDSDVVVGEAVGNYYSVAINFNVADSLFAYKEGKKPQTFGQYQEMVKTILGIEEVSHGTAYGTDYSSGNHVVGSTQYKDLIIEFRVVNNNLA